jgi:hypothetical protein
MAFQQTVYDSIINAGDISEALKICRDAINNGELVNPSEKGHQLDILNAIEWEYNKLKAVDAENAKLDIHARITSGNIGKKLDSEKKKHYMERIARVYGNATGQKNEFGGIVGFVIHHKILSLILLIAIIIVIKIVKG